MRTTKGQRILVFASLLIIAWALHVIFCNWEIQSRRRTYRLITFEHGTMTLPPPRLAPGVPGPPGQTIQTYTGLFAGQLLPTSLAWGLGVLLPGALIVTDIYLLLGWRAQSRIARNLCTKCAYDLRGSDGDKCPECGTARDGDHRSDAVPLLRRRPSSAGLPCAPGTACRKAGQAVAPGQAVRDFPVRSARLAA